MGGWLVFPYLHKLGAGTSERLKERVAREIKTTFASAYSGEVSLAGALSLDNIAAYSKRATGQKYLVLPNAGVG